MGGHEKHNSVLLLQHISGQSNRPLSLPPHSLGHQQVITELSTDVANGLTAEQASDRLAEFGRNELSQEGGVRPLRILLEQVFNAMTVVLVLALIACFGTFSWIEGGILSGIVCINIGIGFFQSLQAERTVNSLRSLGSPACKVLRQSKTITMLTAGLVPGDIVDLETGNSVPADIRLIEAMNLEADEALLTGESAPVAKSPNSVFDEDTGPGDRLNVLFSSTTITKGRGRGVVFATGMCTEIGLIAGALNSSPVTENLSFVGKIKSKVGEFLGLTVGTPLQRKIARLFLYLLAFALVCFIVVLAANKFDSNRDIIVYAVSTAIGTIPISLLLVLTVTMAAGAKKMLERHVIVRNMSSLEALGGVTNICSDKTGTLTQGRMIVRQAWLPGHGTYLVESEKDAYNPTGGRVEFNPAAPIDVADGTTHKSNNSSRVIMPNAAVTTQLQWFLNTASLANLAIIEPPVSDEGIDGEWKARGAPTEIAIAVFAGLFGWTRPNISQQWSQIAEFPFDSSVKRMSVIFEDTNSRAAHMFTKASTLLPRLR
jgi:Na+-exporting ATPase